MSEDRTPVTMTYIGRRETTKGKIIPFFKQKDTGENVAFAKLKACPYPIGTVLTIDQATNGGWYVNSMKPIGFHEDATAVGAWEVESKVASAQERMKAMLAKKGDVLDARLKALTDCIDQLNPLDRSAARMYVMGRLMGR